MYRFHLYSFQLTGKYITNSVTNDLCLFLFLIFILLYFMFVHCYIYLFYLTCSNENPYLIRYNIHRHDRQDKNIFYTKCKYENSIPFLCRVECVQDLDYLICIFDSNFSMCSVCVLLISFEWHKILGQHWFYLVHWLDTWTKKTIVAFIPITDVN